jgi:hypothetical protein
VSENKEDWKPMVNKAAWYISEAQNIIEGLVIHMFDDDTYELWSKKIIGKVRRDRSRLFPTALDALKSIGIFDFDGNPVTLFR